MMLESFISRKGSSSTTASSTPPMSRASSYSSSSSSVDTNSGNNSLGRGISLVPLVGDIHPHHRTGRGAPERSLRQRATTTTTTTATGPLSEAMDDNSLSNSEDESPPSSKGNGSHSPPSVLKSVLGINAPPFLMGPHLFSTSTSEITGRGHNLHNGNGQHEPLRPRKDSSDKGVISILDKGSSSGGINLLYRRSAPQSQSLQPSPLMASNSTSFHASSCSDIDLENNGDGSCEHLPLISTTATSSSNNIQRGGRLQSQQLQQQQSKQNSNNYMFSLRSREQIIIHFLLEARMLYTDLFFILFATFYQFFHSAVTNIAYYQHAQLTAANRVPLRDIAFDLLPQLDGDLWIVSEYILLVIIVLAMSCVVSNLVVKWHAPHGRPIYSMQMARRIGVTLICCQTLRMISFLVTTLPGASRQCRYSVPGGLSGEEMVNGPAPEEGNPR